MKFSIFSNCNYFNVQGLSVPVFNGVVFKKSFRMINCSFSDFDSRNVRFYHTSSKLVTVTLKTNDIRVFITNNGFL